MTIYYNYAPDEEKWLFYLMLMTVSIGILLKLLGKKIVQSRKEIPYELPGIFILVRDNKYFPDEGPFHISRSG